MIEIRNTLNPEEFQQIINDSLEIAQEYLTTENADLIIQSLTDLNYIELRKAEEASYPKAINWNYIINKKLHLEDEGGFNFGFLLQSKNELLGACISAYKPTTQCLEIYGIEQFNRSNILHGRMLEYSLYASRFLLLLAQGKALKLIDVEIGNSKLRNLYKYYGFEECGEKDFIITFEKLTEIIKVIK